jgi:hypothetical protein
VTVSVRSREKIGGNRFVLRARLGSGDPRIFDDLTKLPQVFRKPGGSPALQNETPIRCMAIFSRLLTVTAR